MFLPWSIFTLNITLAVFRFLLVGAVGSLLAIYSRFGGEYANSIRWARQGGYSEMLKSLYHSRYKVPAHVLLAMVITITATFGSGVLDKGVARFINPVVEPRIVNHTAYSSLQFIPAGVDFFFSGWTSSIRHDTDIIATMTSLLIDPKNIPVQVPTRRQFVPRETPYAFVCPQPSFGFLSPYIRLAQNNCSSSVFIGLDGPGTEVLSNSSTNFTVLQRSSNRWGVVIPGAATIDQQQMMITSNFLGGNCKLRESRKYQQIGPDYFSNSGLNSLPTTTTTKCVSESGYMGIVSITSARFTVVANLAFTNVTSTVFDEPDEMLQSMASLIANETANTPDGNFTLLGEVRMSNSTSSFDILVCSLLGTLFPNPSAACIFANLKTITVYPQVPDPLIMAARGGAPYGINLIKSSTAMSIERVPFYNETVSAQVSWSTMRNDSEVVSQYMARLGQNFFANYTESRLYMAYDISDLKNGLEVPIWLLVGVVAIMVACLALSISTSMLVDTRYSSSLYKSIAAEVVSGTAASSPALISAKVDPLEFQGAAFVHETNMCEMDIGSAKALLTDTF